VDPRICPHRDLCLHSALSYQTSWFFQCSTKCITNESTRTSTRFRRSSKSYHWPVESWVPASNFEPDAALNSRLVPSNLQFLQRISPEGEIIDFPLIEISD
jgi:hypothetical protein